MRVQAWRPPPRGQHLRVWLRICWWQKVSNAASCSSRSHLTRVHSFLLRYLRKMTKLAGPTGFCRPHSHCANSHTQTITSTQTSRSTLRLACRISRLDDTIPYVYDLVYPDFAPYRYLDGYHSDPSTAGVTNERAQLVTEESSKVLDVLLPEGCVTSACAMQAKTVLTLPTESATLKFKCAHTARARAGLKHAKHAVVLLSGCIRFRC